MFDVHADSDELEHEYGMALSGKLPVDKYDLIVFAVPHDEYKNNIVESVYDVLVDENSVVMDVKSVIPNELRNKAKYWAL